MPPARKSAGEDALFLDLIEAHRQAEAIFKIRCLSIINRQMPDSWQCAFAALERKDPENWGRKCRSDTTYLKDEGIKVTIQEVSTPASQEDECKEDH